MVTRDGRRHTIRGLEGQTLADVFAANEDIVGEDAVCLSPEGRGVVESHVFIPQEYLDRLPSDAANRRQIEEVALEPQPNSRLASKIILSRDLHRATVAVGGVQPWKTL